MSRLMNCVHLHCQKGVSIHCGGIRGKLALYHCGGQGPTFTDGEVKSEEN